MCWLVFIETGERSADTAVAHNFMCLPDTYCTGRKTSIIQEEETRRGTIHLKARMRDTGKKKQLKVRIHDAENNRSNIQYNTDLNGTGWDWTGLDGTGRD